MSGMSRSRPQSYEKSRERNKAQDLDVEHENDQELEMLKVLSADQEQEADDDGIFSSVDADVGQDESGVDDLFSAPDAAVDDGGFELDDMGIEGVENGKPLQPMDDKGSWEELHARASAAKPSFERILNGLKGATAAIEGTPGNAMVPKKTKKLKKEELKGMGVAEASAARRANKKERNAVKPKEYVQNKHQYSGVAPLKGEDRAEQKAIGKYEGKFDQLLDVVRGTLTFANLADMTTALETIWKSREELNFDIARCKQTYEMGVGPHPTMYGDVKLNIVEKETNHICELQLTIKAMVDAKEKGHGPYEDYRNANPFGAPMRSIKDTEDRRAVGQAIRDSYAIYAPVRRGIDGTADYNKLIETAEALQDHIQNGADLPAEFKELE